LKIWLKLIILGIIVFFVGVIFITAVGSAGGGQAAFLGIPITFIGGIIFVIGILIALTRGYRRALGE